MVARETPLSAGRALAERIRQAVQHGSASVLGQDLSLTVSVGVVGIDAIGTYSSQRTEAEVLALAEATLRRALEGGGNRVEAEGPLALP